MENNYNSVISLARNGKVESVDILMQILKQSESIVKIKLVDFALSEVMSDEGKERIKYYLYNGNDIQRSYAALYFKRSKCYSIVNDAFNKGLIDREQAFSK